MCKEQADISFVLRNVVEIDVADEAVEVQRAVAQGVGLVRERIKELGEGYLRGGKRKEKKKLHNGKEAHVFS